ncbi:MAG: peptidoglycan-binding domain-containing protein [Polyangiaceae bacterium]
MSALIHKSEKFGEIDLSTMSGVQTALGMLGHDAGSVDGIDGVNTQAALRAFQTAVGISADGMIGPNSRKALLAALDAASAA